MTAPKKDPPTETLSPQRNFTLATEDRVRAVAAGPPAFVRRLRSIEDLEEGIVRVLVERCREALAAGIEESGLGDHARASAPLHAFDRLNDLVSRHNRYYPIEANLPCRPRTGELMDRNGEPWKPMPPRSLADLIARALARVSGDS